MSIKLYDPSVTTSRKVLEDMRAVTESGWYLPGPVTNDFEVAWADYCGARFCVATNSGGSALSLSLLALGIPLGAMVLIPALSFAATAFAVVAVGAQPFFVDVDDSGLIDVELVKKIVDTRRVWGVIPVHLYGQYDEQRIGALVDLAREHSLYVVEDACQAHGALGSVQGDVAAFSFYPSKNLGACGQAGAVVTNSSEIAETVAALTNYGCYKKHDHSLLGGNYRTDEIQSAALLAKLPHLARHNDVRRQIAEQYAVLGVSSLATYPSCWHLYPVIVDYPQRVQDVLLAKGIETGRHYPYILPELPQIGQRGEWPNATRIAYGHVTLPMGPHLSHEDVEYVVKEFLDVCT